MSTLYGYVVMLQNLKVKFKTDTSGLEWMITDRVWWPTTGLHLSTSQAFTESEWHCIVCERLRKHNTGTPTEQFILIIKHQLK